MTIGASKKLIIEVRANEFSLRGKNPNIPYSPAELAADADACRAAGAAVYHFHGRASDGAPDLSYSTYRETVGAIRHRADILVHPTLGAEQQQSDMQVRLEPIRRLAADGLRPDFAPLDMGSSNFDLLTEDLSDFATTENVYVNSTKTLRYFAEQLRSLQVKPYLQIWNVPYLRLAEAFHRMGILDGPLWVSLGLSKGASIASHPGTTAGLDAYLDLISDALPIEWSTLLYHGNLLELAPHVVERGGHIAIGIGDYHYADPSPMTNAELVQRMVSLARESGRAIASPDEAKDMLGVA